MVIRKELDDSIARSAVGSPQSTESIRLRRNLDIAEANGFVDRPVESNNKPLNPVYRIDGGRIIYDSRDHSFQLRDKEGRIAGGGNLTFTEGKMFQLLANNKDDVVGYPTITEEIWGINSDYRTPKELIKTYVKRLRRKLEPFNKNTRGSIIKNIPSLGYKLIVSVYIADNIQSVTPSSQITK